MATADANSGSGWRVRMGDRLAFVPAWIEKPDGTLKLGSKAINIFHVFLERGEEEFIDFIVTWPNGRMVFTDTRECQTGTAGTTGLWGTRPASKPGRRRSLSPLAWVAEVTRFIGKEEAERIVHQLRRGNPLNPKKKKSSAS